MEKISLKKLLTLTSEELNLSNFSFESPIDAYGKVLIAYKTNDVKELSQIIKVIEDDIMICQSNYAWKVVLELSYYRLGLLKKCESTMERIIKNNSPGNLWQAEYFVLKAKALQLMNEHQQSYYLCIGTRQIFECMHGVKGNEELDALLQATKEVCFPKCS